MKIEVDLTLSKAEAKQLSGIIGADPQKLPESIAPHARAAIREYAQMFLGQKVFTRGSDIREFRLFLLIREAFKNKIPDEQEVCGLFQCSTTQARSLIRAVMSKYQYELHDAIEATLVQTVKSVKKDSAGDFVAIINNENVVDALNRALASLDGSLPQVSKKKGTVSTYEVKPSSYGRLCTHYSITPVESDKES